MIEKTTCEVDRDNPVIERRWHCGYFFSADPQEGTAVDKRSDDFIACVRNMFQAVTLAYSLDTDTQRIFLTALRDNLTDNLNRMEVED